VFQANVNKLVGGTELGSLLQQPLHLLVLPNRRPARPIPLRRAAPHRSSERLALLPCRQAPTSPTRKLFILVQALRNFLAGLRFTENGLANLMLT
jgi:hypothetical protein